MYPFRNNANFYGEELAPRSIPKLEDVCLRLLIQYIRRYPTYWRPFLHSQPEDAPCRGDRDPLIMACINYSGNKLAPVPMESLRLVIKHSGVSQ